MSIFHVDTKNTGDINLNQYYPIEGQYQKDANRIYQYLLTNFPLFDEIFEIEPLHLYESFIGAVYVVKSTGRIIHINFKSEMIDNNIIRVDCLGEKIIINDDDLIKTFIQLSTLPYKEN